MPAIDRQRTIDMAHQIPGWCFPREIGALWDVLQGSTLHVEVGTYCGKSMFAAACAVLDGGEVVGIDAERYGCGPTLRWVSDVRDATVRACRELRPTVRAAVLIGESPGAARMFRQRPPSSVYIDADHAYDAVLEDLDAWHAVLQHGGLMVGHDYWATDPGVWSAVEEFFGRRSMEIEVIPNTRLWWHRKK